MIDKGKLPEVRTTKEDRRDDKVRKRDTGEKNDESIRWMVVIGVVGRRAWPQGPSRLDLCHCWTCSLVRRIFLHSNFPLISSPSLQTALWYLLADIKRELYLTVHKNELRSVAFHLNGLYFVRIWGYSIFRELQAIVDHPRFIEFAFGIVKNHILFQNFLQEGF